MRSVIRISIYITLLLLLPVALTACARKGPVFVDDGRSLTVKSSPEVLEEADTSALETVDSVEAQRLRHNALATLRAGGSKASEAANLITDVFPADTRAVPVYVERARVDGKDALLIVEAIGPRDGKLKDKRLWILDYEGSVIFSATR